MNIGCKGWRVVPSVLDDSRPWHLIFIFVAVFNISAACCSAGDWPQILGPNRDGVAHDEKLASNWPTSGPSSVWQKRVGEGFAGVAVLSNRVVLFHRLGNDEVIEALDAKSGETIWEQKFPTNYVSSISPDAGPRCVPVIHENYVFLHGADGRLSCVSLATGQVQWSRDAAKEFDAPEGYFGAGSTPIVEGQMLLTNVGGRTDAGLVALDVTTGKTVWTATNERASYSSPVACTIDGVRHVIFVTRLNLVSVDPANGQVRFRFPFGRRGPTVNGANPVVTDRHIFLSSSYGIGATLVRIEGQGATIVFNEKQNLMSSQYMTSVWHEGTLFGIDGRSDAGICHLRAFDPLTQQIFWAKRDFGMASIVVADNKLVILTEDGELVLASASQDTYQELARAKIFNSTTRALPAIARGYLFARDARTLKCIDLRDSPTE